MNRLGLLLIILTLNVTCWGAECLRPFQQWTLEEAVAVLNESSWGRQTTYTRVVEGVGSGIVGEKEIFSTFYTRLLSARPVREAFARVAQINHSYDELPETEKQRFDELTRPGLELDFSDWIVVAVSFRSNHPDYERRVSRYLATATAESLKNRVFLSTESHPRVHLAAYYAPKGDGIGAKFVFPRFLDDVPVVTQDDGRLVFEFDAPVADPELAVDFSISEMIVDGELIL